MSLKVNAALGTVRIDVTTDPDHLAKYGLYLWRKMPDGQWAQIQGAITPETSTTLDIRDHSINISPALLDGCTLMVGAQVNAITQSPLELNLSVKIRQDPGAPGTIGSDVVIERVNYKKAVTPGKDLNLTAEYKFQLV